MNLVAGARAGTALLNAAHMERLKEEVKTSAADIVEMLSKAPLSVAQDLVLKVYEAREEKARSDLLSLEREEGEFKRKMCEADKTFEREITKRKLEADIEIAKRKSAAELEIIKRKSEAELTGALFV